MNVCMRTVEEWKRMTKDNHERETKERMMEDQRGPEPRRKRETRSKDNNLERSKTTTTYITTTRRGEEEI